MKATSKKKTSHAKASPLAPPRSKVATVLVYSRPSGYWYAQARDAATGALITDARGYSPENVLRELQCKYAMIGVTIKSITDEDPYAAGHSTHPHATKKSATQLEREINEALSQGPGRRPHTLKTAAARAAMTADQFNALAERATETLRVDDFEGLLAAVRKLQPRTIVGVYGDYGYKKGVAEGQFIRLAETGPIAASWSRRAIVEEIVPGLRLEGAPRQLDVSPGQLRALPKTKFKRR
jgi:hypothetical protein